MICDMTYLRSLMALSLLEVPLEMTVTCAPIALPNFTPRWPRPPRPATASFMPAFRPK